MATKNRFRTFEFWDGTIFGMAVTAMASLIIAWTFSGVSKENGNILATLLSIPVALAGASMAFWTVLHRMNRTQRQDLLSARAVLPLALARLSTACEEALRQSLSYSDSEPSSLAELKEAIALDDEIISILRDNIRAADPHSREWITLIISHYQVAYARSKDWWNKPNLGNALYGGFQFSFEKRSAAFDWAVLHSLIGHHFDYARGIVDEVPSRLDPHSMWNSLLFAQQSVVLSQEDQKTLEAWVKILGDGYLSDYRLGSLN